MRRTICLSLCAIVLAGAGAVLFGCGSSNNDQGTAFTAIGYNAMDANGLCQSTFITGLKVPISYGTTAEGFTSTALPVLSCMTLSNNLQNEFIRVERVFEDFYIEGASVQPPSSSTALSLVLGPNGTPNSNSSLPEGFKAPNQAIAPFAAIPSEVMEWIGLNRDVLPEPPFTMTVTHYVTAVTSAGDTLDSNSLSLFVAVQPDVIIPPEEATPVPDVTPTAASTEAETEAGTDA